MRLVITGLEYSGKSSLGKRGGRVDRKDDGHRDAGFTTTIGPQSATRS